jgi:hypothetical protein
MLSGIMKALYLFAWSHFLRRTGIHFAGKCSNADPSAADDSVRLGAVLEGGA